MASPIPNLLSVSDYKEMLSKLMVSFTAICTVLFSYLIPNVAWLAPLNDFATWIGQLAPVLPNAAWVAVPAAVLGVLCGMLSHAIKLHDKISNLFRIREQFDLAAIIWPLAVLSRAEIKAIQVDRIRVGRNSLMHSCFYEYASSTSSTPVASKHAITQALTNWSWVWVTVEATVALWIAAAIAVSVADYWFAFTCLAISGSMSVLRNLMINEAHRYATAQVTKIAEDPVRRARIKGELEAA